MAQVTGQGPDLQQQFINLIHAVEGSGLSVLAGSADELLESIVNASALIFGAAAASIALVDEETAELVFRVAYGAGQEELVGLRIPLDKGIAGYVAMTGQPIAISNVREDARFHRDFAASTGYVPESILATPLISENRVIGVMEVLDKINAPSFGLQDMELLGVFARQAALAISQAKKIEVLGETFLAELKRIAHGPEDGGSDLLELMDRIEGQNGDVGEEVRLLAKIYREVGFWGEAEKTACLKIMTAFAEYVRSKPRFG